MAPRVKTYLKLTKATLLWERVWPLLWPVFGVAGLFLSLALFDILPALHPIAHWTFLAILALLAIWTIHRILKNIVHADHRAVLSRLELDSNLKHRPLTSLHDHQVMGDSIVWKEHQRRAAHQTADQLILNPPSPQMARHDPMALRAIVILVLVIAVVYGGHDFGARLGRAVDPANLSGPLQAHIDIWVTPPEYTRILPFHLSYSTNLDVDNTVKTKADEVRRIPYGSTVLSQISATNPVTVKVGARALEFHEIGLSDAGGFRSETTIATQDMSEEITAISIEAEGEELIRWPVRILADTPPVVWFSGTPKTSEQSQGRDRGRLRIALRAEDDFGVQNATLIIMNPAISSITADQDHNNIMRINLPLPRVGAVSVKAAMMRDLSAHEWAGMAVKLRLEVSDMIAQVAQSKVLNATLPERIFNHPVAKALIALRKNLITDLDQQTIIHSIQTLDRITEVPDSYNGDIIAHLAMRVARSRLYQIGSKPLYESPVTEFSSVRQLFWKTAIRIEEGEFVLAALELNQLQDDLMRALREGGYSDLVNEMLDALNQALDRFMAALVEKLADKGMDDISDIPGLSELKEYDLRNMIEDARNLAKNGSLESAEASLRELRAMLDSIEAGLNDDTPMNEFSTARRLIENLEEMSQQQESLLDETFRHTRTLRQSNDANTLGNADGETPQQTLQRFANDQENLRERLNALMPEIGMFMGGIPQSLGDAESSMIKAREFMSIGEGGKAAPQQGKALESLRTTAREIADQLAKHLRAMPGSLPAIQGVVPNFGEDPFGRSGGGGIGSQMDDGMIRVPDQLEMHRVREIYEELRRRAGEYSRPEIDRDYINRLLKQF